MTCVAARGSGELQVRFGERERAGGRPRRRLKKCTRRQLKLDARKTLRPCIWPQGAHRGLSDLTSGSLGLKPRFAPPDDGHTERRDPPQGPAASS